MKKFSILKKVTAFTMVFVLTLSVVQLSAIFFTASAEDCGSFTYEIKEYEAIITGGEIPVDGELVIPNTIDGYSVTQIGAEAFANNQDIKKVVISNSVRIVYYNAFYGCKNLTYVDLGNRVQMLDVGAFENCSSLEYVEIPSSLYSLGTECFWGCPNLNLEINHAIEYIFDNAVPQKGVSSENGENWYNKGYYIGENLFYSDKIGTLEVKNGTKSIALMTLDSDIVIPRSVEFIHPDLYMNIEKMYCYEGSYAQTYALMNGVEFILLNDYYVDFYDEDSFLCSKRIDIDATDTLNCDTVPVKDGYTFMGWSTEKDSDVVYSYNEEVKNLTTKAGDSVSLYAVWDKDKSIIDTPILTVDDIVVNFRGYATIKPEVVLTGNIQYTVTYSILDDSVATVDENGKVFGVDVGTTTVISKLTDSCGNTVTDISRVTVGYSLLQLIVKLVLNIVALVTTTAIQIL